MYGPVCEGGAKEAPKFLADLTESSLSHPKLGDCYSCSISGLAMHDSIVYFVFSGVWSKFTGMEPQLTRVVELRAFSSCGSCAAAHTAHREGSLEDRDTFATLLNCSRHVADVHRTSFPASNIDDTELSPSDSLTVVEDGNSVSFFMQVSTYIEFII